MRADVGISLQILNNQDYSFILRENLARAAARAKPPGAPRVENNIVLLDEKRRKAQIGPASRRRGRLSEAGKRGHKVASGAQLKANFKFRSTPVLDCHA